MTMTADIIAPAAPPAGFGHRLVQSGDPLEGAGFEAIYEAKIRPELVKCEAERRTAMNTFIAGACAAVILVFLEFKLTPSFVPGLATPPGWLVFASVAGPLFLGYLPLEGVARRAKIGVIQSLCAPLGVTYHLLGAQEAQYPLFEQLRLLPHADGKSFQDFFNGRRGGVDFAFCDAHSGERQEPEDGVPRPAFLPHHLQAAPVDHRGAAQFRLVQQP
jgi:hypothetical protein